MTFASVNSIKPFIICCCSYCTIVFSYEIHTRFAKGYPYTVLTLFLCFSEIQKVQNTGKVPTRDNRYVDIYREKQIRVSAKVLVPVREHPKVFINSILSINTLKFFGNSLEYN